MTTTCKKCGGTNVQVAIWIRPNSGEILDDFGSPDSYDTTWCEDCDDHTGVTWEPDPPVEKPEEKHGGATTKTEDSPISRLFNACSTDHEHEDLAQLLVRSGLLWECRCGYRSPENSETCDDCGDGNTAEVTP